VYDQNGWSNTGTPVSYPSIVYGAKYNDNVSSGAELPKQVSAISSIPTVWETNAGTPAGKYNASYDVWFNWSSSASCSGCGDPSGAYLMVWTYRGAGTYPIGTELSDVLYTGGSYWHVWSGDDGPSGAPYIAYVRIGNTTRSAFDLKFFINDAVSRGVVNNSMYLMNVQAGFEIWQDGEGLRTDDFWLDII